MGAQGERIRERFLEEEVELARQDCKNFVSRSSKMNAEEAQRCTRSSKTPMGSSVSPMDWLQPPEHPESRAKEMGPFSVVRQHPQGSGAHELCKNETREER